MERFVARLWGLLLLGAGVLLLLHNFGLLARAEQEAWAVFFALGGLVFLAVFLRERAAWWAAVPGSVLLALAAVIGLSGLQGWCDDLAGAVFLAGSSLGFWLIYLARRENRWPIIPGGALLSAALASALAGVATRPETAGVLLLGLGATFGLLYRLPAPEGRMRWAAIPACVLAGTGLLLAAVSGGVLRYAWPAAFILAGSYLVFRTVRRRDR